jgi:hypothetical protein
LEQGPYVSRFTPVDINPSHLCTPHSHSIHTLCSPIHTSSHALQVFVQLEEGTYVSRFTPVDINPLLEASLANSGSLFSNVDEPLALDVTLLRISLDEIISNALKYRRQRTPLDMVARYASGASRTLRRVAMCLWM